MSSRSQSLWAALIAFGAAVARSQDASRAAGEDYRLRVVEPTEGLGVTGPALRVTVELEPTRRAGTAEPGARATPTPPPRVELFVDGASVGTLAPDQRSVSIQGLAPGPHTLQVTTAGEDGVVIDRKEVHFTMLPPPPG
jgi:hypothetical protein